MTFSPRLLAILFIVIASPFALVGLPQQAAQAHPLGEFTINHYSLLEFERDTVEVLYVLDFAEISALEQIELIDGADGQDVSNADLDSYLEDVVPRLIGGLDLQFAGEKVDLAVDSAEAAFSPGNWGFNLLRVELRLSGTLPASITDEPVSGRYVVRNFPGRLGWHEIVIPDSQTVTVVESGALSEDRSNILRDYPGLEEEAPLQIYDVEFTIVAETEPADRDVAPVATTGEDQGQGSRLQRLTSFAERLVDIEVTTPLAMSITMVGALVWGALHALSPGHGKAVVGAYLIGSRGTARHAAFLGLTVTATHTAGIFALGFVTLALSHLILPETIFPWLSLASGVLVIMIGAGIGYRRWRAYRETGIADDHGHHHHSNDLSHHHGHHHHHSHDHEHHHDHSHKLPDHSHDHGHHHGHHHLGHNYHHHSHDDGHSHLPPGADGSDVTWRSLAALGISGGMVPCPSALVLLLAAISLGRLEFGIVLVVIFSIGLAAVLTTIGLLMVYMRSLFNRYSFETRAPGVLPILSSIAIAIAGVIIVIGAASQTGIV